MPRKFKFPISGRRSPEQPAVLCPAQRVLDLFNQENKKPADRISKKVRDWFSTEARKLGWHGVGFLPDCSVPS